MPKRRAARGRRGGSRGGEPRVKGKKVSQEEQNPDVTDRTKIVSEKENPIKDSVNPSDAEDNKAPDVKLSDTDTVEQVTVDIKDDNKQQTCIDSVTEENIETSEPFSLSEDQAEPVGTDSLEIITDRETGEGNENIIDADEAEEVVEAFIDKESDEDVQYIDEEVIEEKDQELCDVLESQQNKYNKSRKNDLSKGKKGHTYSETGQKNKSVHEENNFEEISDGSMDPLEQIEIIEAISDNEIIITDQDKEKSQTEAGESLEQVFMVIENEDRAEDSDNDYISDASLCGDDDKDDLSLEEISDDDLDSSKKRNLSHSESLQGDKNKNKIDYDKKEEKESASVEDADKTSQKHPLPESEKEKDDNPPKKAKLGQDKSDNDHKTDAHDGAAFYTNIFSSFPVRPLEAADKSSLNSPNVNFSQQHAVSKELSPLKQMSVSTQTHPVSKRGKIVQCNICPISDPVLNLPDQGKRDSSLSSDLIKKYKDQLPSSISDIFKEVTSTAPPKQGSYQFAMGPVTHADIDNPEFRSISLKFVEKFQLCFNSKHQGVFTAQMERQEDVAVLIRKLKQLELGTRFIIFSVIYRHGPDHTEDCLWKASIVFMYSQDRYIERQKILSDGKERARLSLNGVPKAISKDFIQMLFPESLYISTHLGPSMGRSLRLGYSSCISVEETSACYELLLINGQKIVVAPLDPGKEVSSATQTKPGYVDENGIVMIQDSEADMTEEVKSSELDVAMSDHVQSKENSEVNPEHSPVIQDAMNSDELSKTDAMQQDCTQTEGKVDDKNTEIEPNIDMLCKTECVKEGESEIVTKDQTESNTSLVAEQKETDSGDSPCEENLDTKATSDEGDLHGKEPCHDIDKPSGEDTDGNDTVSKISESSPNDDAKCLEKEDGAKCLEKEDDAKCLEKEDDAKCLEKEDDAKCLEKEDDAKCLEKEVHEKESSDEIKELSNNDQIEEESNVIDNTASSILTTNEEMSTVVSETVVNEESKAQKQSEQSNEKGGIENEENEAAEEKNSPKTGQINEAKVKTDKCEKDTCFEDVSDDEMISAESKQKGDVNDDVIILQEDPSLRVVAEIDLTKELDEPGTNGNSDDINVKGDIKEEKPKVDEKLSLTDGNFQVIMEAIDVEVSDDEPERVLYPKYHGQGNAPGVKDSYHLQGHRDGDTQGKESWHLKHYQRPGSRRFTRDGEIYVPKPKDWTASSGFDYYKNESANYEQLSSIRSGSSPGDPYPYDAPSSSWTHKAKTSARGKNTEHRDNYRRDYRRSKSPSPRREQGFERKPSQQHQRHSEHFQHSRQTYSKDFSHGYKYGHGSSSQGRGYSEWHSDHPDSKRRDAYHSSGDHGKIPYHSRSPPYESHKTWKDGHHSSRKSPDHLPSAYDMKTSAPTTSSNFHSRLSDDRRTHKRYRQTLSRSLSPLSDESLSSSSPHSNARKPRTRRSKDLIRHISHSPISISSNSRSLSPVSKSPTPQRFRFIYKSSRDQYPPSDRNKHSRAYSTKKRSRSRSPYWSKSKAKSRSPPYKKNNRSPPYKRVALSPVTNRERVHDKHVTSTSSKQSHATWQSQVDKSRPSASYDTSAGTQAKAKSGDMKSSNFGNFQQGPSPAYGFSVAPANYNAPLPFPQWPNQTFSSTTGYAPQQQQQQPPVYNNPPVPTHYNYSNMPAYTNTSAYSYSYNMPPGGNDPNQMSHANYNPYAAPVPQGTSQTATTTGMTAKKQQESSAKKWSMGGSGGALVFQRILSSDSRNKK